MITTVAAWLAAAHTALDADTDLAAVHVHLGPLVTFDDIGGADLIIVGHDDDDETGTAFEVAAEWRDTGAHAVHQGRADVYLTLVSQSGAPTTVAARLTALSALAGHVRDVLIPSPVGSALGVAGVHWAQESNMRVQLLPTNAGPVARAVLTYTLATLA
jgi:hypothetical protein